MCVLEILDWQILFSTLLLTTSGLYYGQASTVADSPAPLFLTSACPTNGRLGGWGPTNESCGHLWHGQMVPGCSRIPGEEVALSSLATSARSLRSPDCASWWLPSLSFNEDWDQLLALSHMRVGAGGETDVELRHFLPELSPDSRSPTPASWPGSAGSRWHMDCEQTRRPWGSRVSLHCRRGDPLTIWCMHGFILADDSPLNFQ